jgi:CCR4-NOT transcription complex subunit 6
MSSDDSSVVGASPSLGASSVGEILERSYSSGATYTPQQPNRFFTRSASDASYSGSRPTPKKTGFNLRVDQPVQNVELGISAYVRDQGALDANNASWQWYRSLETYVCSNEGCKSKDEKRQALFEYVCFENKARFCSTQCLKESWGKQKAINQFRKSVLVDGDPKTQNAADEDVLNGGAPYVTETEEKKFEFVSSTREYLPTAEDVHRLLKCEVASHSGLSSSICSRMVLPFPEMPPQRAVVYAQAQHPVTADRIRVVTYNILASIYATSTMFGYCPIWALAWNFRKGRILNEIIGYDADVLCMQEVQADHFESFLYPQLSAIGYEGLYKKKTREAFGPKGRIDGCAMFYKRSKFTLRVNNVIEFNEAAMKMANEDRFHNPIPMEGDNTNSINRLLRDNVAQICVLEMVGQYGVPIQICVSNVHIFWDPKFADVKLWQAHILVKELQNFIAQNDLPLILMGDFNSEPKSSVYELLQKGRVSQDHSDLAKDLIGILPKVERLRHDLALASAYETVLGEEPVFTNYTANYKGTLDYIWYSADRLVPTAALDIPSPVELEENCGKGGGMPHTKYPSDHFSMCCDFSFIDRQMLHQQQ